MRSAGVKILKAQHSGEGAVDFQPPANHSPSYDHSIAVSLLYSECSFEAFSTTQEVPRLKLDRHLSRSSKILEPAP